MTEPAKRRRPPVAGELGASPRRRDESVQRVSGAAAGVVRAEALVEILDPLLEGPLTAVPLDSAVARRAAEIRARHYHRSSRPISLADAVLIASAQQGDRIATADPDVLAVANAEKLDSVALPGQG